MWLTDINNVTYTEALQENICSFLDWSLVKAGGYRTVPLNSPESKLKKVDNKNNAGSTYQTLYSNLVWESGVGTGISGVYHNTNFLPLNSGYYIDYIHGDVVFNGNITGNVSMEYSSKWVTVRPAQEFPFFSKILNEGLYPESPSPSDFQPYGLKVNLPVIAVEVIRRTNKPYEIGSLSRDAKSDVKLYIVATNPSDCTRLGDIIIERVFRDIYMYNPNEVAISGAYPLDVKNRLVDNTKTYAELSKLNIDGGYRYRVCEILDVHGEQTHPLNHNIHMKTVTWKTNTVLP